MKKRFFFDSGKSIAGAVMLAGICCSDLGTLATRAAEPKHLLVVTTTTGFRHSSIETGEKVLAQLGQQSGAFTVDFARVTPPVAPRKPTSPKDTGDAEKFKADQETFASAMDKYKAAEAKFRVAEAGYREEQKRVLADKLSAESLKKYDGVVFENTTGDLPIPDKEAFLAWLRSGKAFIGMHSCSDTFHGWPGFIDMLGGELFGNLREHFGDFRFEAADVAVNAFRRDGGGGLESLFGFPLLHPALRIQLGGAFLLQLFC